MADRTQRRMIEPDEGPRDPFAELTRIMGFDPRLPVRPAPATANAASAEPQVQDPDDFGIDLEKELMGAFDEPAETRYAPREPDPLGTWTDRPALDGVEAEPRTHAPEALDLDALSLDDGFEQAFTASLEQELALDDEWMAHDTGLGAGAREPENGVHPLARGGEPDLWATAIAVPSEPGLSAELDQFEFETATAPQTGYHVGVGNQIDSVEHHAAPTDSYDTDRYDIDAPDAEAPSHAAHAFEAEAQPYYDADSAEPQGTAAAAAPDSHEAQADTGYYAAHPAVVIEPDLEQSFEREFETLLADPEPAFEAPQRAAADAPGEGGAAPAEYSEYFADPGEPAAPDWDYAASELAPADASIEQAGLSAEWLDEPRAIAPEYSSTGSEDYFEPQSAQESSAAGFDLAAEEQRSADTYRASPDLQVTPASQTLSSEYDAWNADEFIASLDGEDAGAADPEVTRAFEFAEPAARSEEHQFSLGDEHGASPAEHNGYLDQDPHAAADWLGFDDSPQALAEPADEVAFEPAYAGSMDTAEPLQQVVAEQSYETELDDPSAQGSNAPGTVVSPPDDDPFAALAAMAAQYRSGRQAPDWRPQTAFTPALVSFNAQPAPAGNHGTMQLKQPIRDETPEIETVDIPEQPVALADDLDIPEVAYAEQPRTPSAYDDLDAEFAGLLQEMANGEPVRPEPVRPEPVEQRSGPDHETAWDGYDSTDPRTYTQAANYPAELGYSRPAASGGQPPYAALSDEYDQPYTQTDEPDWSQTSDAAASEFEDQTFEQMPLAGEEPREAPRRPMGRGLLVAAVVGGVALLGGIAAAALSLGDGNVSGAPVLVRADTGPLKVRPENPGGTQVPNQDNEVYETVTGTPDAEPAQEKLLSTEEEPLDVTEPEAELALGEPQDEVEAAIDGMPADATGDVIAATPKAELQDEQAITAKGEDRLEQVIAASEQPAAAELIAVAPRKVRTMIVKPDGTLVPREVTEPEPAAVGVPEAGAEAIPLEPAGDEGVAADAAATGAASPDTAVDAPLQAPSADQSVASNTADATAVTGTAAQQARVAALAPTQTTPASMRVAPARPAEQPVEVVGEVKADQTAALAAPATGAWSMQIASQPTEASARSAYADLARRYGNVLAGRSASIVKAEVAGKGTYYRVRVPASSRNEAVELCTKYKAAGGNCFVSK